MPDGPAVLAIDPGREKCGVAVVARSAAGVLGFETAYHGVVRVDELGALVAELVERFSPAAVIVGNGTNSAEIARIARDATRIEPVIVDEGFSTIAARRRFFEENPPRGWRKLVPLSLQTPGVAYDDYVAVILAEQYLAARELKNP